MAVRKKIRAFIQGIPGFPRARKKTLGKNLASLEELLINERVKTESTQREVLVMRKALKECWKLSQKSKNAVAINKVILSALCQSTPPPAPAHKLRHF
jgi:hypothetical protein